MKEHQKKERKEDSRKQEAPKGIRRSKPGIYEEDFDPEIYCEEFEKEQRLLSLETQYLGRH